MASKLKVERTCDRCGKIMETTEVADNAPIANGATPPVFEATLVLTSGEHRTVTFRDLDVECRLRIGKLLSQVELTTTPESGATPTPTPRKKKTEAAAQA